MAYSLPQLVDLFQNAGSDAEKMAIYNGVSQFGGGIGGAFDAALKQTNGAQKFTDWLTHNDTLYGSGNANFDPSTGKMVYRAVDTGKNVEGQLPGYDPGQWEGTGDQVRKDMQTWQSTGKYPGIVATPTGPTGSPTPRMLATAPENGPGNGPAPVATPPPNATTTPRGGNPTPPPLQPGGPTMPGGRLDPSRPPMGPPITPRVPVSTGSPLQPGHGATGPGITTGPGARQPGTPIDYASLLQDLIKQFGGKLPGGLTTGPPEQQGPPGAGGPPGGPPPPGGAPPPPHGTSPYPNINAQAGTNPATYTGLPMRGFDPSNLIQAMRAHFQGKSGAGQQFQMPPVAPQQVQNNLQQWDAIFAKG